MKKTAYLLGAAALGLSLFVTGGCHVNRRERVEAKQKELNATDSDQEYSAKQEVRQSYKLAAGTKVDVSGINGLLQIETADTDAAEIHIVRSARSEEDFKERTLVIEQKGDSLVVRMRNNRERSFWAMLSSRHPERQQAFLKLPRQINLDVSGINGKTEIGEIGGRVELSGLNGPVKVARATGGFELSGVNGNIEATLAQLTKGVEVRGVNGSVDLRFLGEVNADIEVHGVNGSINPELPNLSVKEQKRGRLEARLGNGGTTIEVSGVNGNINFLPAKNAQTAKTAGGADVTATK
ncbi:MAG: DUF4097 family beta strand repeat protein [Acidobacteria bacterium]|nr:DUF4097 family beta strand repeat protein [Acidobacteriota bacterium]MBI3426133.1 DUF4097 family beta strand repeat protein [Acidobacteriota bacterium]